MDNELISIVVPCYNEQEVLPLFYDEMIKVTDGMKSKYPQLEFEFLFINDGSRDNTLKLLRELSQRDERVRYVSFSRNFGKESGLIAGLENSRGDYVVTLDADLQHPPALIPQMYEYVRSGEYDCAGTRRISRKGEPKLLSFFSRLFYKIINKISQTEIVDGAQDYRFMTRQMVDAIINMPEYNRFSKGIFSWVGFNTKYIEVENVERAAGKTTWSFRKLFLYSLEGIFAFSTAPLALASFLGVLFCLAAFVMIIIVIVKTLVWGEPVAGFPTLICTIMFIGGLQLLCTGILGQYLSKTYLETKARPKYIVKETEEIYKKRSGK
ncbi:MAG: glycosyltransferase family 2 protein [Oscillospiraceae bacterium]